MSLEPDGRIDSRGTRRAAGPQRAPGPGGCKRVWGRGISSQATRRVGSGVDFNVSSQAETTSAAVEWRPLRAFIATAQSRRPDADSIQRGASGTLAHGAGSRRS